MNNTPSIVFVFRYSNKEQQIRLCAEKKIPTSLLRGLDHYIAAGLPCGYIETGKVTLREILSMFQHTDVVLLNDALLSFAFLNILFRKKLYYLNISGSTLLRSKTGINRLAFIWFLRMVTATICISTGQIEDLRRIGISDKHIRFLKFGVDTDFFDEDVRFENNATTGYIVSLGRDRGRDFESLFQIASQLPEEKFIIATNKARVPEDMQRPKNVEVRYDLNPIEVRELYRGAKCCIVTLKDDLSTEGSDCSGQTVVQETMSTGMPVFCTRRQWLDDYFEPFVHYVPLEQGDVQSMVVTLREYLHDSVRLYAIGLRGKEENKKELNTKLFADRLYKILCESYA